MEETAGRVGTVGRKLPIAVSAGGSGVAERTRVGVTLDHHGIGHFADLIGEQLQEVLACGSGIGTAGDEEQALFGFEEIDAQTFAGDAELDVIANLGNCLLYTSRCV